MWKTIKQKIKDLYKSIYREFQIRLLCYYFNKNIKQADLIDRFARELEFENSQHFINWQDELNKISVK